MGRRAWAWAVAFATLTALGTGSAGADEYHYLLIFGSQSRPKVLRKTHTWATFVRATGTGPDLSTYQLEVLTISWLPRTLDVHVWRPWPEPGVNATLEQTLDLVQGPGQDQRVTLWGPFLIRPELFQRAQRVAQVLDSGRAQYRAISTAADLLVSDCIHAVAAVDPIFGRRHYPLIRIGKPASRYIARQVMTRSLYEQWQYDNSWLIPRLGLDRRGIEVVPPQQIPKQSCVLCGCPE